MSLSKTLSSLRKECLLSELFATTTQLFPVYVRCRVVFFSAYVSNRRGMCFVLEFCSIVILLCSQLYGQETVFVCPVVRNESIA